ncbi:MULTISPECIES: hypothetical protein [unclassified Paenibacillus]|uniref:hypothetical protein n=1 Tax=unclassified Paenibacillus TaxID=185978 RepID=UPI00211AFD34|nr:hypothetical protein [Paenibacillus sp. VTT E-133280]
MQIEFMHDLIQTAMTIDYKGRSLKIDNLVIDTGAAHSLLSSDIVSELGIRFENGESELIMKELITSTVLSDWIF